MEGNTTTPLPETTHTHTADCAHGKECTPEEAKKTLCVAKLQFETFEQKGWHFYHSVYPMFSAKQLDQISDTVGTMSMPEVFYGFNHLYVVCPGADVILEFSPVQALQLSAFAKQREMVKGAGSLEEKVGKLDISGVSAAASHDEIERELNRVDLQPERIEVKEAHIWKKKDMSKVKDFK